MPPITLVSNAEAGGVKADAIAGARTVLASRTEVDHHETASIGELDELVTGLDGRVLVVAGGDGSLHAAVNALHRAGNLQCTTVGLIPLGTGNDLARSVGIPLDPFSAAMTVIDGEPQALDLLEGPESTLAVNAVHLGIGTEAVLAGDSLKGRLGPAAYPAGALLAGVRHRGWRLQVRLDGQTLPGDGRVLMVGISVGRSIGGGAPLAPEAEVDDGAVDVTVASTTGPIERVRFASRLRNGRHRDLPGVTAARGRTISVEGDAVRANIDGEVTEPRPEWIWRARARAWRLIRPAAD